ncbi:hypothetical protein BCR39DRAFT_554089 [Naematelia encephala]|uniref:Uncharacterized protein n=1 Tax=Naematelia encephala TaxID=71784 RepID=A0A1Y2AFH9_9TREE|nr:hypothetical protein BCR39DRAFT_554089 [Naematelia encephala]
MVRPLLAHPGSAVQRKYRRRKLDHDPGVDAWMSRLGYRLVSKQGVQSLYDAGLHRCQRCVSHDHLCLIPPFRKIRYTDFPTGLPPRYDRLACDHCSRAGRACGSSTFGKRASDGSYCWIERDGLLERVPKHESPDSLSGPSSLNPVSSGTPYISPDQSKSAVTGTHFRMTTPLPNPSNEQSDRTHSTPDNLIKDGQHSATTEELAASKAVETVSPYRSVSPSKEYSLSLPYDTDIHQMERETTSPSPTLMSVSCRSRRNARTESTQICSQDTVLPNHCIP